MYLEMTATEYEISGLVCLARYSRAPTALASGNAVAFTGSTRMH
jgi:hypothetical protein